MNPSLDLLCLDDLDSRRELWHLLHRLPPARRLAYLLRCCMAVSDSRGNGPRPTADMRDRMVPEAVRCSRADERLTNSFYMDIVALSHQMGLDLAAVARDLERLGRTGYAAPLAEAHLAAAVFSRS